MKKIALLIILTISLTSQAFAGDFLTTTIEDIGRPYEVIDGICMHQVFPRHSAFKDPLAVALQKAFEKIEQAAKEAGADALIGFDVDFSYETMKGNKPRVLVCGTLVKFK